jgi:hypothetical protein
LRYVIANILHKGNNKDNNNNNNNNKRTILHNKPDVIIHDNIKETCVLIGAISREKCDQERS